MRESLYCCYNFLFYNEVSYLSWLLDIDILLKYINFYVLCVCVCVFVGARGSTMKLKSGNIGVGMPRARGRKPPEEKEEMSQGTSER